MLIHHADARDLQNIEMVAAAEIEIIGVNLTSPLTLLDYSLHDSFLYSQCASCFSSLPLNPPPFLPPHLYCSPSCFSSHSSLHLSSASHHLHLHLSQNHYNGQTSDLRVAFLFLHQIKRHHHSFSQHDRIHGLLSNRHQLITSIHDDEFPPALRKGEGNHRSYNDERDIYDSKFSKEYSEAVLCVVLTNLVEVQDRYGRSVGIAVYDTCFSWIN